MNDRGLSDRAMDHLSSQYRTLLEVSESIVSHRELTDLFHDLAQRLRHVLQFDYLSLRLHDPKRNVMRRHILEKSSPVKELIASELGVEESLSGWVWQNQKPILIGNVELETRFPRAMQILRENDIKSCCCLPLTTAHRRLGAVTLGSVHGRAYEEADPGFLEQVARQVAVAVDNALNFERAQSYSDRLRTLLEINNAIVSNLDLKKLFSAVTASLRRVAPHECVSFGLYDSAIRKIKLYKPDCVAGSGPIQETLTLSLDEGPGGKAILLRKASVVTADELKDYPKMVPLLVEQGIKSICSVPMISHDRVVGVLSMANRREEGFAPEDVEFLNQVANQIAIAVDNALAFQEIENLKDKLVEEKLYLEEEIRTEHNFEEIIGQSHALKHVLKQVETVAPTDSTVLILGETGTGKELIARAIHNLSGRRERAFVKMNCAAIPTGLLESELFGHEKGAFTGAIAQKVGRFELAAGGTLFLDEIGDIPLELQPKLLRVLQEQEFERLGSTRTIRVDIRQVAATNSDLVRMVTEKQFRSDLYYRLNVFPIVIPPLRERREDIPLLLRYFVQKYARRMKKRVDTIPARSMPALSAYHWPGNVRELENFIERAVILSPGPELRVPLAELKTAASPSNGANTLEDAEREHILKILKESNWVVGGPSGAAARLGMKRTTLQARIKKLGITRPS
ncbi:MAG: sigma 54-interacting transcriptional regulator [Deltaproteobacteria bacterium]|nr:sigma 54-interacting transcriptional regulator [Deltaproteobacteria bacterium]